MFLCVYVLKARWLAQRVNQVEAQLWVDMEHATTDEVTSEN
jgi:hypothetical protein